MKVHVELMNDPDKFMRRACEMTMRPGKTSKVSRRSMYKCEHSPIRTIWFWVELLGVPTFVSVHLVRHHMGVDPFVQSNRDDRGGDQVVTRDTPVQHGCQINAQALIQMSRKRLCLHSHRATVAWWQRLRRKVREIDPALPDFMVPECVYRGFCPEMRECKVGATKVIRAYSKDNPEYSFRIGEPHNG